MITTQKQRPSFRPVTVKEVVADIYGFCPRCDDLCYVKPNHDVDRPEMKFQLEQLGERGKYLVDWHDYEGRRRSGTCYGSNAIPSRLVKVPIHFDYVGSGFCEFCGTPKNQWIAWEECVSRKAAIELFEPGTSVEEMAKVCHRWTLYSGHEQNRILRRIRPDAYATALDQYLGATPLAELHIPTAKNCGNHLTVDEAREIVKIARAAITA